MKKKAFHLLWSLCFVMLWFIGTEKVVLQQAYARGRELYAVKLDSPPVIDGIIERWPYIVDMYGGISEIKFSEKEDVVFHPEKWQGPKDLSAQLAMSANYDPKQHLFRTEIAGDKIKFSIDQEEVGELKREAPERYYMITPDPYTSHYAGSISIDWIKIKGPNVQSVELEAKLATTWCNIKNRN